MSLDHKFYESIKTFGYFFAVLMMALISTQVKAQNTSEKGWFEADNSTGCGPFTVNITHLNLRPGRLFVDFEGDPNDRFNTQEGFSQAFDPNETISYTYNTPGNYLIRIVDGSNDPIIENRFDFLAIEVIEAVPPDFTIDLCQGNEVSLAFNFNADAYNFYQIDFGDGNAPINLSKNGNDIFNYSYASQGSYDITVSGKLNLGDDVNCGVAPVVSISTLNSIPVPTITRLESLTENSLRLNYAALEANINYVLEANSGNGFENIQTIDPSQNPTTLEITDNAYNNLESSYSFRIVASDPCGGAEVSNEVSSIALDYTLVNIDNSINVRYQWTTNEVPNATSLELIQNGASILSTTTLSGDTNISYTDCLNLSTLFMELVNGSTTIRSLLLTPFENQNLDLPATNAPVGELVDNNVELQFEQPPFSFAEIEVFRKNGAGTFMPIGTSNTLAFTDFGVSGNFADACYVIRYRDECGNQSLESPETCIPLEGVLRIPNAFSPNGLPENQTFNVGQGVFTNFQMLIYNKWGTLIYKGNDPRNGWDGMAFGEEAPSGTYRYIITFLKGGIKLKRTGTVTLFR